MLINPIYSNQNSQRFSFPSNLQSIDSLEILLNDLKEKFGITDQVYSSIWITLNEAITNAVVHGNKNDINKKVQLSVELKWDNFICFTIKDEGDGFDYENIPDPTTPENIEKLSGRGVFLLKKLADLVLFSNSGNTVDLYFDLVKV